MKAVPAFLHVALCILIDTENCWHAGGIPYCAYYDMSSIPEGAFLNGVIGEIS